MKIALDRTPLVTGHKIRGVGFYTENLIKALRQYDKKNSYIFFIRGEKLPKDIDLVHYPYFDPFFLTLPLRKLTKTVVTIHDLIPLVFPDKFPSGIRGKIKWKLQKYSLKGVEAVITDSESSKKDITRLAGFPKEKIQVVYLAPSPVFRPLKMDSSILRIIEQKYNLPKRFVLYVGDVTRNKNIPGLVMATKRLDIPLVIVGKQAAEKQFDRNHPENKDLVFLEKEAEKDRRIIRAGFIQTEDLVAIYNLATVYCQPSFYEGFGLPVLEAMACGVPVVAANTSSLPEICADAAVMVNPRDKESIASGLSQVLSFDERQRDLLVEKGKRNAARFTWVKTAQETVAVYEKVLGLRK